MPKKKRDSPSPSKKRSIANILTSLAALEDQDASERRQADAASLHDLSLLQSNHQSRLHATLDYFDRVDDHFEDAEQSETLRTKRSRLAASAAATVVADGAASAAQPQHHQRRLWLEDDFLHGHSQARGAPNKTDGDGDHFNDPFEAGASSDGRKGKSSFERRSKQRKMDIMDLLVDQ
ncbi:hypothetical protein J5N97_018377 [Dioscorea zingiberensis]|uniref:Uncharacterized protein n=1 Tax=Dioscorea zingiberensis TaxID=325984 RepID=A0A9D5HHK4_9LILI|nr:hypothetical protein J5N97_018377 [Dioscorea zingiberensis]